MATEPLGLENRGDTTSPQSGSPGVSSVKRRSETDLTYSLKWAAWEWLYREAGCRAVAFEVRLEGPSGRVADVVGLGPKNLVYVVEVKASRSDASRDNNNTGAVNRLREKERALDEAAEFTTSVLEAAARAARLKAEDDWADDPAYRQAAGDHQRTAKRRAAHARRMETLSIKFYDPAFLRVADCHYIMAPSGLVRPSEVPPFWGLLDERPAVVVPAPVKQVRRVTAHVLRAIARANTRDLMTACGRRHEILPEKMPHNPIDDGPGQE